MCTSTKCCRDILSIGGGELDIPQRVWTRLNQRLVFFPGLSIDGTGSEDASLWSGSHRELLNEFVIYRDMVASERREERGSKELSYIISKIS